MDADEGGSEGVGGEGGEGGGAIAVAIEKADHSLEKDHLVLFQGFEIKGTFHMYMYMCIHAQYIARIAQETSSL